MKTFIAAALVLLDFGNSAIAQTFVWAKQFAGTGWNGEGRFIALDESGNIYVTGSFSDSMDFDPGPGTFYLSPGGSFIAKLNNNGDFIWAKRVNAWIQKSVVVNGNIYTTGSFNLTVDFDPGPGVFNLTNASSFGQHDAFVSKLDTNGNFVWAKQIAGNSAEEGRAVAVDSNGNVYVMGVFSGTVDFDPGIGTYNLTATGSETFICKLDADGNFIWADKIGGPSVTSGWSIALDAAGNPCITGEFRGTADFDPGPGTYNLSSVADSTDVFVLKLDSTGDFQWVKQFEGADNDASRMVTIDAAGYVYIIGGFRDTLDFDPSSLTYKIISAGDFDVFVLKLEPSGELIWANAIGGANLDVGHSIAVDAEGNVYSLGFYVYAADFDPGVGVYNLTTMEWGNVFVSKLDSAGNFVWAKQMGGPDYDDIGLALALDDDGNIYSTGSFLGTADFDPGIGTYDLTASGNNPFVVKLKSSGGCMEPIVTYSIDSPLCNGDTSAITLTTGGATAPYSYIWSTGSTSQNLSNILAGIYDVTITDALGCGIAHSIIVTEPVVFSSAFANGGWSFPDDASTSDCDGSASPSPNGGTHPFYYLWSTGATVSPLTGLCAGTYDVTVTDANGCSFHSTLVVDVVNSVASSESTSIRMFPNPADDVLQIESSSLIESVVITDAVGKQIVLPPSRLNTIDISGLTPGIYIIEISTKSNRNRQRFVKMN